MLVVKGGPGPLHSRDRTLGGLIDCDKAPAGLR